MRTSSGRDSLDALKREVRGTLKNKSVTARVCRTCPFPICLSRREIETSFLLLEMTKRNAFQYVYPVGRLKLVGICGVALTIRFLICLSRREIERAFRTQNMALKFLVLLSLRETEKQQKMEAKECWNDL